MVIMLKSSYIFICFLSLMYQCKGGKVCRRDIFVVIIHMITMLKFSYFIYIFLLYHSNGTKSTPKKRKHEEGNEDAVTKKSKIVRTKRGTDVRINTYMYSVVVVFIYKFFTFSPLSLLTLFLYLYCSHLP
jgi:hypothetical protein